MRPRKPMYSVVISSWNGHNCSIYIKMAWLRILTCLCMKTTEPSNLHVPPCLSTCNMRRIWRKRMPRMAEVANTCPLEPNVRTTIDATTTIKSVKDCKVGHTKSNQDKTKLVLCLPIIHIGFLIKRSLPQKPMYLDLQPADQRRTKYSAPKNTTRHIS